MRVAIVGSRRWPDRARVQSFVAGVVKKYPGAEFVSGGAPGADRFGEGTALHLGALVWSFRPERALGDRPRRPVPPFEREDENGDLSEDYHRRFAEWRERMVAYQAEFDRVKDLWCVVLYKTQADPSDPLYVSESQVILPKRYPSFAAAAKARNTMIVQQATEVVAFHFQGSPGTAHARSEAERLKKRLHVFEV